MLGVLQTAPSHEDAHLQPDLRTRVENPAAEAPAPAGRTMSEDVPREFAMKIDLLLDLIDAGSIRPDPLKLLHAALTLREHGEIERARRCESIARRLLPNLWVS